MPPPASAGGSDPVREGRTPPDPANARVLLRSLEDLRDSLSVRVEQLSLAVDRLRGQASQLEQAVSSGTALAPGFGRPRPQATAIDPIPRPTLSYVPTRYRYDQFDGPVSNAPAERRRGPSPPPDVKPPTREGRPPTNLSALASQRAPVVVRSPAVQESRKEGEGEDKAENVGEEEESKEEEEEEEHNGVAALEHPERSVPEVPEGVSESAAEAQPEEGTAFAADIAFETYGRMRREALAARQRRDRPSRSSIWDNTTGLTTTGLTVEQRIAGTSEATAPTAFPGPFPSLATGGHGELDRQINHLHQVLETSQREWHSLWHLERTRALLAGGRVPNEYSHEREAAMRRHVANSHRLWTLVSRRSRLYGTAESSPEPRLTVDAINHIANTSPSFLRPSTRSEIPSLSRPTHNISSLTTASGVGRVPGTLRPNANAYYLLGPPQSGIEDARIHWGRNPIDLTSRGRSETSRRSTSARNQPRSETGEEMWNRLEARAFELAQERSQPTATLPVSPDSGFPFDENLPADVTRVHMVDYIEQSRAWVHEMARTWGPDSLVAEIPAVQRVLERLTHLLSIPDFWQESAVRRRLEDLLDRERGLFRDLQRAQARSTGTGGSAAVDTQRQARASPLNTRLPGAFSVSRRAPASILEAHSQARAVVLENTIQLEASRNTSEQRHSMTGLSNLQAQMADIRARAESMNTRSIGDREVLDRIEDTRSRLRELLAMRGDLADARASLGLEPARRTRVETLSRRGSDAETVVPPSFSASDIATFDEVPPPIPAPPARLAPGPQAVSAPTSPTVYSLSLGDSSTLRTDPDDIPSEVSDAETSSSTSHRATLSHTQDDGSSSASKEAGELGADTWPAPRARPPPRPYISLLDL